MTILDIPESTEIPENSIDPVERRSHTTTRSSPGRSLKAQRAGRDRPVLLWFICTKALS